MACRACDYRRRRRRRLAATATSTTTSQCRSGLCLSGLESGTIPSALRPKLFLDMTYQFVNAKPDQRADTTDRWASCQSQRQRQHQASRGRRRDRQEGAEGGQVQFGHSLKRRLGEHRMQLLKTICRTLKNAQCMQMTLNWSDTIAHTHSHILTHLHTQIVALTRTHAHTACVALESPRKLPPN